MGSAITREHSSVINSLLFNFYEVLEMLVFKSSSNDLEFE